MGGPRPDAVQGLGVDHVGDRVYVAGEFDQSATLGLLQSQGGPDTTTPTLTSLSTSSQDADIFIMSVNRSTGARLWYLQIGGAGDVRDERTAINSEARRLYLTASFRSTVTFQLVGGSQVSLTSAGDRDVFVLALDLDSHELLWVVHAVRGTSGHWPESIAERDGVVYVAGSARGITTYAGTDALTAQTVSATDTAPRAFVLALSTAGEFRWVTTAGGVAS